MPEIKLVESRLASLPSNGKDREDYADLLMPGLHFRVSASGHRSWSVVYRIKGRARQQRLTLGPYPRVTLGEARDRARDVLNRAAAGVDPQEKNADEPTVAEVAAEFMARHVEPNLAGTTVVMYRNILKADLLPALGGRPVRDVRKRDIIAVVDRVVDRGAPIQANRVLQVISSLFSFAVARDAADFNPCAGIPLPAKERQRTTVLPLASLVAIWKACEGEHVVHSAYLRLRILTGKRQSEIVRLRWQDLTEDWWNLPAEYSKNRKPDRIYLTPLFHGLLKTLSPITGGREWALASAQWPERPIACIDPFTASIREKAEVPFTGREIRAAVITGWSEMGVAPHIVSVLANHTIPGVTRKHYDRYAFDQEKAAALTAWDARLQAALAGQEPARVLPMRAPATP